MKSSNIKWRINNEGFVFYSSADCGIRDDIGDVASQILMCLVDEEKAREVEGGILVPHNRAAWLDKETTETLSMPPAYPFIIDISMEGELSGHASSVYNVIFRRNDGMIIVNPVRKGCFLSISDYENYMFVKEQYELICAIEKHNNQDHNLPKHEMYRNNLINFLDIKNFSEKTCTVLDSYLRDMSVVRPEKFSVSISKVNDEILIEPTIVKRVSEENGSYSESEYVVDAEWSENFKKRFHALNEVSNVYRGENNTKIVLSPEQKEGLRAVKRHSRFSGREKSEFLAAPQNFLDADVFDFTNFSDRVKEIGEHKPRVFPFLSPLKESWLPPEAGLVIDDEKIKVQPDEMLVLKEQILHAMNNGLPSVEWNGKNMPATAEMLSSLDELIDLGAASGSTYKEVSENMKNKGIGRNVFIIRDNSEDLDFAAEIENVRQGEYFIPSALKKEISLFPHQAEGLKWLVTIWQSGYKGALLADDMGLGKTIQALAFLCWIRETGANSTIQRKPMLIVAPVALLHNWRDEYLRFFDSSVFTDPIELHGSGIRRYQDRKNCGSSDSKEGKSSSLDIKSIPDNALVLTTYETLRDYQLSFGLVNWGVIVLDEAQKIKTPSAMVTTAVRAMKYDFGLCLTGTPVENSWVDLWSIMDFAQPGKLGSMKAFNKIYQAPLSKPETDREVLGLRLQEELKPLLLRRLKEDKLEGLPEKKIYQYKLAMPEAQLEEYMNAAISAKRKICGIADNKRKNHILRTILKLRDISLHPDANRFSDNGFANMPADEIISRSARFIETFAILDEIKKKREKALIFLLSRKMQLVVQRLISEKYSIDCARPINGEVPGDRRKDIIDAFQQKDGFQVLILSPEAAGVGLNITAANHVIHLSRLWNPAKEDQATDRVYRIGQNRNVCVYLPMAVHPDLGEVGSFDEKLDRLLGNKRRLSANVLLPPIVEETDQYEFGEDLISGSFDGIRPTATYVTLDDVDRFSGNSFEEYILNVYVNMGYDAIIDLGEKNTGSHILLLPSKDSAKGLVVNCKHSDDPMNCKTAEGIAELAFSLGKYRERYSVDFSGMMITNAVNFTSEAIQRANESSIYLCTREKIEGWINSTPVEKSKIA